MQGARAQKEVDDYHQQAMQEHLMQAWLVHLDSSLYHPANLPAYQITTFKKYRLMHACVPSTLVREVV